MDQVVIVTLYRDAKTVYAPGYKKAVSVKSLPEQRQEYISLTQPPNQLWVNYNTPTVLATKLLVPDYGFMWIKETPSQFITMAQQAAQSPNHLIVDTFTIGTGPGQIPPGATWQSTLIANVVFDDIILDNAGQLQKVTYTPAAQNTANPTMGKLDFTAIGGLVTGSTLTISFYNV